MAESVTNPLDDIENAKAQIDMGTLAYRLYLGARQDGATHFVGFLVVVAYFRGLFGSHRDEEKDE